MRKLVVIIGAVVLLVAVPIAVVAATGRLSGRLERQAAKWTTTPARTSSTAWRGVPGLRITRCMRDQVTAMLTVTVRGAPVQFRGVIDGVPEAPMRPGAVRFVPDGTESFAATLVARTGPFEADDTHSVAVQWRSPTGGEIALRRGALNLLFQRGEQGCP